MLAVNSLFVGFEKRHGRAALQAALAELPVGLDFLEDRRNWLSFDLLLDILDRLVGASGEADFARFAGRLTVSEETLGLTYSVMRAVGSPRLLYRYLFGNAHLYNRVGRMVLVHLSDTEAEVVYTPLRPEWNDTPLILQHRLGQFEAMPAVFGLPHAQVQVHTETQDGITRVRYHLQWLRRRREWLDWRLWLAFALACGLTWLMQTRVHQPPLPAGTLFPVLVWLGGWAYLRHARQDKDARRLVQLLESTLAQAHARHDELRSANLKLEQLRRQLEQKVVAQDAELSKRFDALQEAYAELEQLATCDGLTGLYNRRSGDLALTRLVDEHTHSGAPLCVLLFDLDHFKKVNDTWGHAGGDTVLATVGQALRRHFEPPLVAARYGGEEFLVLLPNLSARAALAQVLAFQDELRATHPLDEAPEYVIRISGGLVRLGSVFADAPALVRGADELLYAAKHRGRDCILHQPRDPARGPTPAWTESCFGAPE